MSWEVVETRCDDETTVSLLSRYNPFNNTTDWRVEIASGGDTMKEGRDSEHEARAFFQAMCLAAGINVTVQPPRYEWTPPDVPIAPIVHAHMGDDGDFGTDATRITASSLYLKYHMELSFAGGGTDEATRLKEQMIEDPQVIEFVDGIEEMAKSGVWVDALIRTVCKRIRRRQEQIVQQEKEAIAATIPGYGAF